jgi:predicted phosphoribosyltransferase
VRPFRNTEGADRRTRFADRLDAGRLLADRLATEPTDEVGPDGGGVVLGLLRGGVPVAAEVARRLGWALGAVAVRKIGVPGQPELARGAVTANGALVLNDPAVPGSRGPGPELAGAVERARREAQAIEQRFLPPGGGLPVARRRVVLVDDGLATGATMRAAVAGVRRDGAAHVTVAVPVGAPAACALLAVEADRVVCVASPEPFVAVGAWYRDFSQLDDDEVRAALGPTGT